MEITPEIQAEIDKQVAAKVDEVRSTFEEERDKIANNSKKLLAEKKNLEERFSGIDPDDYRAMKEALKGKEEEDLLKSGKIDELVNRRVQVIKADLENQINERDQKISEQEQRYGNLNSAFDEYRIRDALNREGRAERMLDSALDDLVLRARGVFSIDSEGNIVSLDGEGNLKTVDGKPVTPKSFIQGLKKTAPHLWPASESGDLGGSGDKSSPFGRGSSLDEAASSGDMAKYRKLRAKQKQG